MYPFWSRDEVWNICLFILEKDSPIPGLTRSLVKYRSDFYEVFEKIYEEHRNINRKYYRTEDKTPIVNPLHIAHYTRLIYYFSRALFLKNVDNLILDQMFFSMKTRCNIDLFYEVELKRYFLPEHALGTVIGRAKYDSHLVVCQNCTIGNNKNVYPSFGKHVVLRPGATVLGDCHIGDNVQISAGTIVIDRDIPSNSIVFGRSPDLIVKETRDIGISSFFDK